METKLNGAVAAEAFGWFVGIDWGTKEHAVYVADATGQRIAERSVEHTSAGLTQFIDWLPTQTSNQLERVAIGIEVPRGSLVELLLERGAAVFAVNPKQLDRFRDRFSVAGAKDDRLDARVLASAVQTDRHHFRRLTIDEPVVIRVRELTRETEVLQQDFMAATNRLRELVHRIAPEWLKLSTNADDPWFWRFLEQAATPVRGRGLRRRKIEQLLQDHRIRRVSVDDVLDVLDGDPLHVAPGTVDAVTSRIQQLLRRVRLVHEQQQVCEQEIESLLEALTSIDGAGPSDAGPSGEGPSNAGASNRPDDVAILQSIAGVGTVVTSTFIAEAYALLRLRDYASLRAVTGVAPVRRQTGTNKRGSISMRYACNLRLRNACHHWARVSTRVDAASKAYYAALRARGHSHGRALRSVADRWLRILIAMLKTKTLYDPSRFASA